MKSFILAAVCVSLGAAATAQPVITSLSATALPRSGRLLVQGTGFGAAQGSSHIDIGGFPALVTRWSDTLIAAYVPEAAPVAPDGVQVLTSAGASNIVAVSVSLRQPNGRIRWRFQADSDYIFQRPAVGADGTIVAHDSGGFVYSLTPDGGLKWIYHTRVFAGSVPSVGADGSVYVADSSTITALDANGALKWTFTDPGARDILAGPTVGPDGNIYAVSDIGGIGVYALSPTGQLLWSNPGDPTLIAERGPLGAEIAFGPSHAGGPVDQLYVAFDDLSLDARNHLRAFRLTGSQAWALPLFMSKDQFSSGQQQPAVGPDGTVFLTAVIPIEGNWSLNAFDPATGALKRQFFPNPGNGMSAADIGPDGSAYYVQSLSYLQSVSASNSLLWQYFDGSIVSYPIVNSTGTVVATGGAQAFGVPGFFRAFSAVTGKLLFTIDLGTENGGNQVMQSRPRFSSDGNTAYFGTVIAGSSAVDTYCYLYAVDTSTSVVLPTLSSVSLSPTSVVGGSPSTGTVTLTAPAQSGGAMVTLSSNIAAASVPNSVTVMAGKTTGTFAVSTTTVASQVIATITGSLNGTSKSAALTITQASDTVAIQNATYFRSSKQVYVAATSTSSTAVMKVYVTSTGAFIGTLKNRGGGSYTGQFPWPVSPVNVTVRSSLGGSASRNVVLR